MSYNAFFAPNIRKIRFSYLYQEDIAQIIDVKLPICLLNNKRILISACAMNLLESYLISNLVTLKKFYELNMEIYVMPPTKEYFGCTCVKSLSSVRDCHEKLDYIINIDSVQNSFTQSLIQRAQDDGARYVHIRLDGQNTQMFMSDALSVSVINLFGMLPTENNIIQTVIERLAVGETLDFPNGQFEATSAQYAVNEILKGIFSDEKNMKIVEGTINPIGIVECCLNDKKPKYDLLIKAVETVKLLKREFDENA